MSSAVEIAAVLGVSSRIVALTVVASGTSLPELATSVVAALHGERDIAVGNVIGSNIFNILAVLGVSGLASRNGLTIGREIIHFDLPIMVAVAVVCLPVFFTGGRVSRGEGVFLLVTYIGYCTFVFFASESRTYGIIEAFGFFIGPLAALTAVFLITDRGRGQRSNRMDR